MKDPENTNEKNETPEEMSLADLLGADTAEPSSSDGPTRVNEREDEPESGVVRLAEMVASSSTEQARTSSVIPPEPVMTDATPTAGVQLESGTSPAVVSSSAPAQPKSSFGMIALVCVALVACGIAAAMFFKGADDGEAESRAKISELEAKLTMLAKQKDAQSENASAQASKEMEAKLAAITAQLNEAKAAKDAAKEAADEEKKEVEEEQPARQDAAIEKAKPSPAAEVKPKATRLARKSQKSAPAAKPARTAPSKTAKSAKTKVAKKDSKKPAGGTSELDALLGGNSKKKAAPKAKASVASGLPPKPNKTSVRQAMNPVVKRAQSCSKYSTGTIQLKIVVGNNGRVKSSSAMGAFAGTTAGKCVEMLARTAKFPKFADPTATVVYPVTLR